MEHSPCWSVIDVLLDSGDQPDAKLFQGVDHDCVINPVPGEAAEHVDNHVPHIGVIVKVGDHLLELGTLPDGCPRTARVDELGGFPRTDFTPTLMNLFALRWDGYPLGVVVGIDLSLRGNAQICNVVISDDAIYCFLFPRHVSGFSFPAFRVL
ncbi:hypothetical protein OG324_09000 [Streptomyces sp. NBC_01236]|nr:hypothetical protein OG324_09000 [Streptomyces sp. NBC_01236]